MNPILAGLALAVTVGTVIAVSAREARAAFIGLAVAIGLGPFLADPLPAPAVLAARVVTGILVVYLLRATWAGDSVRGLGSRLGWPAEAVLAAGAAVAGIALAAGLASLQAGPLSPESGSNLLDTLTPSAVALATGLASVALGLAPALLSRSSLPTTIGLLLMVQGVVLARTGIAGPPGEFEQLGINGLVLAVGAAGALLAIVARRGTVDVAAPDVR